MPAVDRDACPVVPRPRPTRAGIYSLCCVASKHCTLALESLSTDLLHALLRVVECIARRCRGVEPSCSSLPVGRYCVCGNGNGMEIVDLSDISCRDNFLHSNPKYTVTQLTAWKKLRCQQKATFGDIKQNLLRCLPDKQGDERLAYLSTYDNGGAFNKDELWLRMSLHRWSALGDFFIREHGMLGGTYDLDFLTFLNDAIISQGDRPIWRDTAVPSESYADQAGETMDATVRHRRAFIQALVLKKSVCGRNHIVGRFKLVKAMVHNTCTAVVSADFGPGFGTIGVHLRQRGSIVELVAYQLLWTGNQYELHQLFLHELPKCISNGTGTLRTSDDTIERAINILTDVAALAKYLATLTQWKKVAKSPIPIPIATRSNTDETRKDDGSRTRKARTWAPPRPPVFRDPPTRSGIKQHHITPFGYTLTRSTPISEGYFADVFVARHDSSSTEVVLKVQPLRPHTRELHVLRQLRDVRCAVSVLNCMQLGEDVFGLVLPRLQPIGFHELKGNAPAIADFARDAGAAVHELHRHGVAHGDIKPAAFMQRADGTIVLVDFNFSKKVDSKVGFGPGRTSLSGSPAFVFDDSPAKVHGDGDVIGFAAVIGWLLPLYSLNNPDHDYDIAFRCVQSALRTALPPDVLLLQYVIRLLRLERPTRWEPPEL